MPLSILVPMILVGLPLVIGLVYWFSGSKQSPLSEDMVSELFQRDFPHDEWDAILLDDDAKTAILLKNSLPVGLVTAVGQNHITRRFDGKMLRSAEPSSKGVDLVLNDFTLKRINLALDNPQVRQDLLEKLAMAV